MSNKMQTIKANNYPIYFNEKGYEALNYHLKETKYSNIFIIVNPDKIQILNQNCRIYKRKMIRVYLKIFLIHD